MIRFISLAAIAGLVLAMVGAARAEPTYTYPCEKKPAEIRTPPPIAAPGSGTDPVPRQDAPAPLQMFGCVEEAIGLDPHPTTDESLAVRAADPEAEAEAVLRGFVTEEQRDSYIVDWLTTRASGDFASSGSLHILPHTFALYRASDGTLAYAIYPYEGTSGELCLTLVGPSASRAYVPVLNNWCRDMLGREDPTS